MKPKWVVLYHAKNGDKYVKSRHNTKEAAVNMATQLSLKKPKIKFTVEMEMR